MRKIVFSRALFAGALLGFAFAASAGTVYVGKTNAADDADHGAKADAPYATVAYAVAQLGSEGGTVYIATGTYTETAAQTCVSVAAPIEIVGATGKPEDVTITKGSQCARIFSLNHAQAKLRYLTVSGGNTGNEKVAMSTRSGSGVYIGTSGGVVEDCIISGNKTGYGWNNNGEGTGIYMASSADARVTRCRIQNNDCGYGKNGAAICLAGKGLVECSLIAGNTGTYNYSAYLAGAGTMINCTVSDNVDADTSGVYAHKNARVVNCAIFGNRTSLDTTRRQHVWGGTAASFINCAADVQIAGTDCHSEWAGLSESGDYTITPSSCALDGGTDPTSYGLTSLTDLAGNAWYSGANYDCGCFELDQTKLGCDFRYVHSSLITCATSPATVTFTAYTVGASGSVSYEWDFGDGSEKVTTTENPVEHQYPVGGTYTVTLKTTDASGSATSTRTGCVKVSPADIYVNDDNESPESPYDTPEKATTSIATAIEMANDGAVIHVLDGTYKITSRLEMAKAITIKGESGSADKVLINAQRKCQGVYVHNAAALLQYVTVSNCYYLGNGGCAQISVFGGTIEDCILTHGDVSGTYSNKGGALYMAAGRASRCVLRNGYTPSRSDFQGGGSGLGMSGGLCEDCLITKNNCRQDCTVYLTGSAKMVNCTVAGNTGTDHSGVYVADNTVSVVNCAIFGNTSSSGTDISRVICSKDNAFNKPARFFSCAWDADIDSEFPGSVCCKYVVDPLFKDATAGNYRISVSSELCDAGTNRSNYACVSTTDLDGKTRVVDKVDIGCYENQKDEMDVSFSIASVQPVLPAAVSLVGAVKGAVGTVTYEWNITNKTVGGALITRSSGTNSEYTWEPEAAGTYDITLKASAAETIETAAQSVQIGCQDLYVKPVNDAAEFPYDTPAKASTSIQTAIDAAVDGSTIHVLPGEDGTAQYTIKSKISVTKALELVGETDCRTNILINAGTSDRALYVNNADALVRNLAFRGFNNANGRTVILEGSGGTLSNCCIHAVRNGSSSAWGNCGALFGTNARLLQCEFVGNGVDHLASSHGAMLCLFDSRIENSIIHDAVCTMLNANDTVDGGAMAALYNSSAVNCTFVNTACDRPSSKSVIVNATSAITNCVVVGITNTTGTASLSISGSAVNCATDDAEPISATSITASTSDFRDYAAGDYRPSVFGVLRDAGAEVELSSSTDLAGNRRVFGKAIDIGAYECQKIPGLRLILR